MSNFAPRGYVAACSLNMTALPAVAIFDNDGFDPAGCTDNGAGDWTITLGSLRAIDAEDRNVNVEVVGATPAITSYENVSDTQIRVHAVDAAGAGTDVTVAVTVTRKTVGTL